MKKKTLFFFFSLTKFLSFIAVFSSAPAAFIACTVATLSLTDSSANDVCSMLNCWLYNWSRWDSSIFFCLSTASARRLAASC